MLPTEYKNIDKLQINNDCFAYSYNGAKFDNHFILSGIKNIHKSEWYRNVSYIGSP